MSGGKRIYSFCLAMLFVLVCPVSSRAEEAKLKLYSQSAVLMDGDSGRILYGKAETQIRPMASTTKIMTCILALERGNRDDLVTASSRAASQPQVRMGVKKGERYRLEELLYALMLESYNDAAVMIAEHIGGSVEGFAKMMNAKAKELNCPDTWFITPNGLDGKEIDADGIERIHSTTAADLARILRYCIRQSDKKEEFLEITRKQSVWFQEADGKRQVSCSNHNAFLNMMEGALTGKTGFTGGAGYSYVGALEHQGRLYIIALLGCGWPPHKTYKWADARALFSYGKENFIKKEWNLPETLPILTAEGGPCWQEPNQVPLMLKEEMKGQVLGREEEEIAVEYQLPQTLSAPISRTESVGSIRVRIGTEQLAQYPLYPAVSVEKQTLPLSFSHVLKQFIPAVSPSS